MSGKKHSIPRREYRVAVSGVTDEADAVRLTTMTNVLAAAGINNHGSTNMIVEIDPYEARLATAAAGESCESHEVSLVTPNLVDGTRRSSSTTAVIPDVTPAR